MNNFELEHCLLTNKKTVKIFRGVYSANKLADIKTIKNGYYIANTAPNTSKGIHWVGFFINSNCVEIFDTSGLLFVHNKYFKRFIKKCNREVVTNKFIVQNPHSNICGQYCVVFALYKARGISFCTFLNLFNETNLSKNDRIVLSIFKNNFVNTQCFQYSTNLYKCIQK